MADVDPETLLEWLQMGQGDERDMQQIALEQVRCCKYVILWSPRPAQTPTPKPFSLKPLCIQML